MSSIIYGFAKADTKKKEVLTFYKFEQTVIRLERVVMLVKREIQMIVCSQCRGEGKIEKKIQVPGVDVLGDRYRVCPGCNGCRVVRQITTVEIEQVG